jgi:hypothetical protein
MTSGADDPAGAGAGASTCMGAGERAAQPRGGEWGRVRERARR